METNSILYQRFSCREFTVDEVSRDLLLQIAEAGTQAPSARNERPWEFLIVTSREGRESLAATGPQAVSCQCAPAVIIAMANTVRLQENSPWWIQDMSACIENMLLRATELGLGSVWLGLYPREARVKAVQKAFGLPEDLIPVAAVPIGYPKEPGRGYERRDEGRIHWEEPQ